eukprot:1137517-Pelagomonas_calceolata.AAC.3
MHSSSRHARLLLREAEQKGWHPLSCNSGCKEDLSAGYAVHPLESLAVLGHERKQGIKLCILLQDLGTHATSNGSAHEHVNLAPGRGFVAYTSLLVWFRSCRAHTSIASRFPHLGHNWRCTERCTLFFFQPCFLQVEAHTVRMLLTEHSAAAPLLVEAHTLQLSVCPHCKDAQYIGKMHNTAGLPT